MKLKTKNFLRIELDLKNRKIRIVSNAFSEESMSPLPKTGIVSLGLLFVSRIKSHFASPLYICLRVLPCIEIKIVLMMIKCHFYILIH